MSTQRLTITLPAAVAEQIRKEAKRKKHPISRVIAEALIEQERERIRQLMIEGYIATREESRKIAEEFWPIAGETWPID